MDKFWNDLPDVIYSFKNHTYMLSSLRINFRQEKVTIVLFFDRVRDSDLGLDNELKLGKK